MTTPEKPQPRLIRLQRYLASCGLGSRRACEDLIREGRVSVDGQLVEEMGTRVDPQSQQVSLDGEVLHMERKKYYVVNKPTGVLSTNRDPQGRTRVIDLFPPGQPRLFTVGRLDEDSEGLLIVTNDGDLAQKLAHPSYRIFRTYELQVAGIPSPESLAQLKRGLHFTEGKFRVQEATILKVRGRSALVQIVLTEGHNRELRRLFARIGNKVMKLRRVAFGPVRLGSLPSGEFRELRRPELAELIEIIGRNIAEGAPQTSGRPSPAKRAKSSEYSPRSRTSKPKSAFAKGGRGKSGPPRTGHAKSAHSKSTKSGRPNPKATKRRSKHSGPKKSPRPQRRDHDS